MVETYKNKLSREEIKKILQENNHMQKIIQKDDQNLENTKSNNNSVILEKDENLIDIDANTRNLNELNNQANQINNQISSRAVLNKTL